LGRSAGSRNISYATSVKSTRVKIFRLAIWGSERQTTEERIAKARELMGFTARDGDDIAAAFVRMPV
jgi:hypothetical protein